MSIIKGTQSGIHAKLTPTYIVSFGWKPVENEPDNFSKKGEYIVWDEEHRRFIFQYSYKDRPDTLAENYEYYFDVYEQLKILEQYLFSNHLEEKKKVFEKILANSKKVHPLFGMAANVIAKTICFDMVPVQPMAAPTGVMSYMDFPYTKKK